MDDGLYIVGMAYPTLASKTIVRRPINDYKHELTGAMSAGHWARVRRQYPPYRGDLRGAGTLIFGFDQTGISSGTITNVAIHILCLTAYGANDTLGSLQTVLAVGGTNYYGSSVTSFRSQKYYNGTAYSYSLNAGRPSWRHTDYTTKPGGAPWAWSDVNALQAGVKLISGGALASCFEVKAIISFLDANGYPREITIRPISDISGSCTDNINSSMVHTFLDGNDINYWATASSTSYRSFLTAILPLDVEVKTVSAVKIKYTAKKNASLITGNSRGILRLAGAEYYGTERTLTTNATEYLDTWTLSPATGLPFTQEEIETLNWGVQMKGNSASYPCYLYFPDIEFDVSIVQKSLTKIPARITRGTKRPKNPITADELEFTVPFETPIPDYADVLLVVHGAPAWVGLVISKEEKPNFIRAKCKSRDWLLGYRYIPHFIFCSDFRDMGRWSGSTANHSLHYPPQSNMDLAGFFASDAPRWHDAEAYYDANRTQLYCSLGLLFQANSCIPNGKWEAYSSTVAKLPGAGRKSCFGPAALYACTQFPRSTNGELDSYNIEGIKKLRPAASLAAIGSNEYWRTDDDLYVKYGDGSYPPNGFLVYAHNWADMGIRLGEVENESLRFGTDFDCEGQASAAINDICQKAGQEIEFIPGKDGLAYMRIATEAGRGSADNPVRIFVHGQDDCTILLGSSQEPKIQAVIGANSDTEPTATCQVASNWDWRGTQLFKVLNKEDYTKDQMQAVLDKELEIRQDINYYVTLPADWGLRVGDHVRVTPENSNPIDMRVAQIDYTTIDGMMTVLVGKRLVPISKIWGDILRANVASDASPIQETEIMFQEAGLENIDLGFDSFIITKEAAKKDNGLQIVYEESFKSPDDDQPNSLGVVCQIEINDKIIPPGKILLVKAGVEIDITDYCNMSESVDTSNQIGRTLFLASGWTSTGATVKQYPAKINLVNEV